LSSQSTWRAARNRIEQLWSRVRPGRRGRAGPSRRRRGESRAWQQVVRRRLLTAGVCFTLWTLGIEARLVFLQVLQHDELTARAEGQQSRSIDAHPKRGEIVDRHGRMLAYSVDGDSIYAVPADVEDAAGATAALCAVLDCMPDERRTIEARLAGSGPFAYVRRQVLPSRARAVAELELTGIGFLPENRRYYPHGELAAHVLGFVGLDNEGLGGIESTYDEEIRGRPGRILVQTDARRRAFSRLERPPASRVTSERSSGKSASRPVGAGINSCMRGTSPCRRSRRRIPSRRGGAGSSGRGAAPAGRLPKASSIRSRAAASRSPATTSTALSGR